MLFTKKEKGIIIFISGFILLGSFWILLNKIYFKKVPKNVNNLNDNIQIYTENNVGNKNGNNSNIVKNNLTKKSIITEKKLNNDNNEQKKQKNSAKLAKKININTGNIEELKKIPYIGPSKGKKIIIYREKNGKFKTCKDIINVSGIGEKTFEKIKELIEV